MSPEMILLTIQACAKSAEEFFRFLGTPVGQDMAKKALEDSEKAAKVFEDAGNWLEKVFTGKL